MTAPTKNLSVIYLVKDPPIDRLAAQVEYMRAVADEFIFVIDSRTSDEDIDTITMWPGATVVLFHWVSDFSLARNAALPFVSRAWTLHLDPDELPSYRMMTFLKGVTAYPEQMGKTIGYLFWTRNWWGGVEGEQKDYHWHLRLWKSDRGYFYRKVHELVMLDGKPEHETRNNIAEFAPKEAYLIHSKSADSLEMDQKYYESLGEASS